ncbi:hypothetical protein Plhal304r1_c075g0162841 [Plasmopara halstedii]
MTCTATPPDSVVVQRTRYGPGLDDIRGQGRIGVDTTSIFHNECSASLAALLTGQTIAASTAIKNERSST